MNPLQSVAPTEMDVAPRRLEINAGVLRDHLNRVKSVQIWYSSDDSICGGVNYEQTEQLALRQD